MMMMIIKILPKHLLPVHHQNGCSHSRRSITSKIICIFVSFLKFYRIFFLFFFFFEMEFLLLYFNYTMRTLDRRRLVSKIFVLRVISVYKYVYRN